MREKKAFENQRIKLLLLLKIFLEETDQNNWLSTEEILYKLNHMDVEIEKRAFYEMYHDLELAGYAMGKRRRGNRWEYALLKRDFELSELKILIASVQSSRFLTDTKARELTNKIKSLTSRHQSATLYSGMHAYGRIRSMNESIYKNLDILNIAVEERRKVKFNYFEWDYRGERHYRNDGKFYYVSPYLIVSQSDKVYMVGLDDKDNKVKNFRIDKMENVIATDDEAVLIDCPARNNPTEYISSMFNMYGGKKIIRVKLECRKSIANVIVDTFGRDLIMIPHNDDFFHVDVNVAPGPQFYGWVIGLHPHVKVIEPSEQVGEIRKLIDSLKNEYLPE